MEEKREKYHWLICIDCNSEFVLTSAEVEWYEKNLLIPPRRCPACRLKRKLASKSNQGGKK